MKKNVYLVEDNFEISELIEFLLTDINLNVKAFSTGAELRKNLQDHLPDLFILDIMLPDANGIDICREIKESKDTKSIPVILMSAHVNIKTKAMESAADDFISKPFDIEEFTRKVRRLVA